jgi:hypothetical protein
MNSSRPFLDPRREEEDKERVSYTGKLMLDSGHGSGLARRSLVMKRTGNFSVSHLAA